MDIHRFRGTDIYYKVANGHQALTGTLYGTASLSYEEFYAGDATSRKYDSVTSATTRKSTVSEMQMFRI